MTTKNTELDNNPNFQMFPISDTIEGSGHPPGRPREWHVFEFLPTTNAPQHSPCLWTVHRPNNSSEPPNTRRDTANSYFVSSWREDRRNWYGLPPTSPLRWECFSSEVCLWFSAVTTFVRGTPWLRWKLLTIIGKHTAYIVKPVNTCNRPPRRRVV